MLISSPLIAFRRRTDRLLLQRLRKSQSGTALYGEGQQQQQQVVEEFIEPSVYSAYEGATSQRLIVVANRLPVSAVRERDGWSLQVCPASCGGTPRHACYTLIRGSMHVLDAFIATMLCNDGSLQAHARCLSS